MGERFPDVDPERLASLLERYEALVVAQQEAILELRAERDAARHVAVRLVALEAMALRTAVLVERLVARLDLVVLRQKGELRMKPCAFPREGGTLCGRPFRPRGGGQRYCDECGRVAKAQAVATGRRRLMAKRRADAQAHHARAPVVTTGEGV